MFRKEGNAFSTLDFKNTQETLKIELLFKRTTPQITFNCCLQPPLQLALTENVLGRTNSLCSHIRLG